MILLTLAVLSTAVTCLATVAVLRWSSKPVKMKRCNVGVSVIKPIRGLEPELEQNLRSFLELSRKVEHEILFCIKQENDPAVAIVRGLMIEHPLTPARLFVGTPDLGKNPKVSNMHYAWTRAQYDLILVSDSNVKVAPDYLERLMYERQQGAGLVTQAVYGVDAKTVGGHLDVIHLNTFYLKATAFLNVLNYQCVLGKCVFLSRSQFENVGGLFAVRNYLAEDLVSGDLMRDAGYTLAIAPQLLRQTTVMCDFKSYLNRHMRWARLRKCHGPFAYLIEPLFIETIWPVLLMVSSPSASSLRVGLTCLVLQITSNLIIHAVKFREKGAWRSFHWFLVKDLIAPYVWLGGLLSNKVLWRGQTLYLRFGGKLFSRRIRSAWSVRG